MAKAHACQSCKRRFRNESALAMHNRTVHPGQNQAQRQTKRRGFASSFIGSALGVLVGGGLLLLAAPLLEGKPVNLVKAVNAAVIRR